MKITNWSNEPSRWWLPQPDTMIPSDIIFADRRRMWGNATIGGTRVPLFRVLELHGAGYSIDQIGNEIYPHLGPELIIAALREVGYDFAYTEDALDDRTLVATS